MYAQEERYFVSKRHFCFHQNISTDILLECKYDRSPYKRAISNVFEPRVDIPCILRDPSNSIVSTYMYTYISPQIRYLDSESKARI